MRQKKTAVIIVAGPAGLTAALELLKRTDIHPIVIERDPEYVGGISRTVNYKGNRIDIGGHRFFSKSERVMRWWSEILPVAVPHSAPTTISYQRTTKALTEGLKRASNADGTNILNVRPRKTRIVHGGKFFAYPIELSVDTLLKLGLAKTAKIGYTYLSAALFPIRPERTLEDFFINRFGTELYQTFFKSYTEKVWGTTCSSMSAEWGKQRIKGLSISKAISHAAKKILGVGALAGKGVETSLIEQFLYPSLGPGLMWQKVAEKVIAKGGELRQGCDVIGLTHVENRIVSVTIVDLNGRREVIPADYVFSSTDIQTLIQSLSPNAPDNILKVSNGLQYRDFLTVGLLLSEPPKEKDGTVLTDTWMYIHEEGVKAGRIQFFHNWSQHLVADQKHGWIGLEYFCNEGDELWQLSDPNLISLGAKELVGLSILSGVKVLDGTVVRQKKAYPGYFGSYNKFDTVRIYLDSIENLYPVGRNGMHRYNNQDHSMLAAMTAVDLIVQQSDNKQKLWEVNAEDEYHEQK